MAEALHDQPWVLVLSRSCPPDVGGYQRQMSIILPGLVDRGFHVRGVSAHRTDARGRGGWPGIPSIVLPAHCLPRRIAGVADPVLGLIALLVGALGRVRRRRTTLLLASPTMTGARVVVSIWKRLVGPVVARYPGSGDLTRAQLGTSPQIRHVVLSPEQLDEAAAAGIVPTLVGNAVEAVSLGPSTNVRHRFLVVGRLIATKRVDVVLDAWERVANDLPDWSLEVIGSGQGGRDDVEAQLRERGTALERIQFVGEVPDARLRLTPGAVLVQCSVREGLPNTVLEAMAACIPVIAETNALRAWFGDPPPHVPWDGVSSETLAEVMRAAAENGPRLMEIAAAAGDIVRSRWSADRLTTRWVELLS